MSTQKRIPIPVITLERWCAVAEAARAARAPVVVRGACEKLAGVWTPARFVEQWPEMSIHFTGDLPAHGVPYHEAAATHQATASLRQFVEELRTGRRCYLNQAALANFPELERDFDSKRLRLSRPYSTNVWMGGGTRSGLHFDNADNFFSQVYGDKRAILVHPGDSRYLYPFADNPSKSQVDPENPDPERHSAFARCRLWTADLGPGDALYIPRGFWHFLAADEVSISLNCWHGDSLSELDRLRMFLAGGPRVLLRTASDFVAYGMLRRRHQDRMFSPPPLGLRVYELVRARLGRHAV